MNKRVHRLVFDRKRGMRVPAAEHVRSAGKAGGGQTRAVAAACAAVTLALSGLGEADARTMGDTVPRASTAWAGRTVMDGNGAQIKNPNLPYRSGAYNKFDSKGVAEKNFIYSTDGLSLDINQTEKNVVINWDTFNLCRTCTVTFIQPDKGAALNKIWDGKASVILGKIKANGEVILENTNGVLFGPTARVDTQRFVATALSVLNETFLNGIRNSAVTNPIFGSDADTPNGVVSVERGAEIKALAGGDVMLIAPKVYNEGRIETPGGQSIMAAGQKVYLMASPDPAQRGLLVAVDAFKSPAGGDAAPLPEGTNTVEQAEAATYQVDKDGNTTTPTEYKGLEPLIAKINAVVAEKGTINLVGMSIRQNGVLTATTAVKGHNGAIFLQAGASKRDVVTPPTGITLLKDTNGNPIYGVASQELGSVELGNKSVTSVDPEVSASTQKDADVFYRSRIDVLGSDILVHGGAVLRANSGDINLQAVKTKTQDVGELEANAPSMASDGSRMLIEDGAVIDVSGLRGVALPMSRNQMSGRFFKIELADSPLQRNGVLYRQNVQFDAGDTIGVANATGFYNSIERTANELSTLGGNVRIESLGDLVMANGSVVNIGGGSIHYGSGVVHTSLLRKGNALVSIDKAQAGVQYDELIDSSLGIRTVDEYDQGFDAGTALISGIGKTFVGLSGFKADVLVGPKQRNGLLNMYASRHGASLARPDTLDTGLETHKAAVSSIAHPEQLALARPLAGLIQIGKVDPDNKKSFTMHAINISPEKSPGVGASPEQGSEAADAFFASLPAVTTVSSAEIGQTGAAQVAFLANKVGVQAGASFDLGASGQLSIKANQDILFAGQIKAEGGLASLSSNEGDVELAAGSSIDLSGRRLDERGLNAGTDGLSVDGGGLSLSAGRSVVMDAGSKVDVSAGIWRRAQLADTKGVAGKVDIQINTTDVLVPITAGETTNNELAYDGKLALNGVLRGYDFSKGGTLSIKGLRTLTIGGDAADGGLALASAFFSDMGFGAFALTAAGDVVVKSGARLAPELKNLVVAPTRGRATADTLVAVQTLEQGVRQGVSLSLTASEGPPANGKTVKNGLEHGGSVIVEDKAQIDAGMGGSIKLNAGYGIDVAGRLLARGGAVSLAITGERGSSSSQPDGSGDASGYVEDQLIRLRGSSVIDVSGATRAVTLAGGRVSGEVLGGGTVKLNDNGQTAAVRGRLVTELGSVVNVSGASGALSLGRGAVTTRVSKGAGSVLIGSTDGFLLEGSMLADRPDASVGGGQFLASMSREGFGDVAKSGSQAYTATERAIVVEADAAGVARHREDFLGVGVLSAPLLTQSGFDRVELRADDRVVLQPGVNLVASADKAPFRTVSLNSRVLEVAGHDAHAIKAAYVALGDRNLKPQFGDTNFVSPSSAGGDASLNVQAGLIEVYGHSGLRGTTNTTLSATLGANNLAGARSDGEVRFIGRPFGLESTQVNQYDLFGALNFDGKLTFEAGQVYASTLSNFTVQGRPSSPDDPSDAVVSSLLINGPAGGVSTSHAPLSALASLTLQAHDVEVHGTVRQPFGSIIINGETNPVLGASSVLSVSGDGLSVPVGATINQRTWVYATGGAQGEAGVQPTDLTVKTLDGLGVAKSIVVKGAGLTIDARSQIEAQGGGDIVAAEFVAGVGGSKDTTARKDVYAVLPGYSYEFAPYDTMIRASTSQVGTSLSAGDQIEISTNNGVLAKGRYTLLPASYAVLPGAVLVSQISLNNGGPLSQAITLDDGSAIVSGSKSAVGTSINGGFDGRQGWLLEPETTFRAKSEIDVTSINNLLGQNHAKGSVSRPGDAGRVSLAATNSAFNWDAKYKLGGVDGFAGGQLDLAMPTLSVEADGSASALTSGAVTASALEATGADSIVLGGLRSGTAERTTIEAKASTVQANASIDVKGELMFVATDAVKVADQVRISSSGQISHDVSKLTISGEGAALVVSNRLLTDVTRDLSNVTDRSNDKSLVLGNGVSLSAVSTQLDSSAQILHGEAMTLSTSALGLGSERVAIGNAAVNTNAFLLDDALLNGVTRLQVRGYEGIDLLGDVKVGALNMAGLPRMTDVVLDSRAIGGVATDAVAQTAQIQANHVTLRNTSGRLTDMAAQGNTALMVMTRPAIADATAEGVTIGPGEQRLAFNKVELASTGDIVLRGQGSLGAQGDLMLNAARLTAAAQAKSTIDSDKTLSVLAIEDSNKADNSAQVAGKRTLGDVVGAGANVTLSGQRVVQAGMVDLPSGQLAITGRGQVGNRDTIVFDEGSLTKAAGWVAKAGDTWSAFASAGAIKATAQQGDIVLKGTLDVSAPVSSVAGVESGAAGSVTLAAHQAAVTQVINGKTTTVTPAGALVLGDSARIVGSADKARASGIVTVDAGRLVLEADRTKSAAEATSALSNLVKLVNDGGFHREVDLRIREGDQILSTALQSARVLISADGGKLTLADGANIDAMAERGGMVQLSAQNDLTMLKGASINASSSAAGANGGDVLLASVNGYVDLQAGASVKAEGDDSADGRIVLRAQTETVKDATGKDVVKAKVKKPGATLSAGEKTAELVKIFSDNKSVVMTDTAKLAVGGQDVLAYLSGLKQATFDGYKADLGWSDASYHVSSGVEIQTAGDFTLSKDWSLASIRPGNEPIFLTVRAKGNININGSLSDGFASATRTGDTATAPTALLKGDGSSYRLVAGADMQSANTLKAVESMASGSLTVAAGKMIRTTSGSTELVAAQDIELKAGTGSFPIQGVVYVAGKTSDDPINRASKSATAWEQFTKQGGRLELSAGRDIVSPAAAQQFNNWFQHTGGGAASAVAWWSAFDGFKQGLGSMGGGNVRVVAGQDIKNVAVVAPSSARTVQDARTKQLSQLVENGGDVLVRAGRDVVGGEFLLGRGQGVIEAANAAKVGDTLNEAVMPKAGLLLGLMDGQWTVRTNGDADIAAAFNPTSTESQSKRSSAGSYFTYGDASAVSVLSAAGSIAFGQSGALSLGTGLWGLNKAYTGATSNERISFVASGATTQLDTLLQVAPPSMALMAFGGDVSVGSLALFPSVSGNLVLFGGRDVNLTSKNSNKTLAMVGGDANTWDAYTVKKPATATTTFGKIGQLLEASVISDKVKESTLHVNDPVPARIHAARDLVFQNGASLNLAKAADISAGGDIFTPEVRGQQFRDTDITRIVAGGDIIGGAVRTSGVIQLGGPGELQIEAGRNLDLNTSEGIETVGNQYDSALPAESARIRLAAGMARSVDVKAFEEAFLATNSQARTQLISHVAKLLGLSEATLSYEQALAYFGQLTPSHQTAFAEQVINDRFVATYVAPAPSDSGVDQVWRFLANQAGLSTSDTSSSLYQDYVSGQRALVSYVERVQSVGDLSFADALTRYRSMDDTSKANLIDKKKTLSPAVMAAFLVATDAAPYAQLWQDRVKAASAVQPVGAVAPDVEDHQSALFKQFRDDVMMTELKRLGGAASSVADSSNPLFNDRRKAVRDQFWALASQTAALAGQGAEFKSIGDINIAGSKVFTVGRGDFDHGGIDLFVPDGKVIVGYSGQSAADRAEAASRGMVTNGGSIRSYSDGDFQVNSQKAFVIGTGDLLVYSANGNIDSGRGSNTDVAVPPAQVKRSQLGEVYLYTPPPISGSGIGIIKGANGSFVGKVSLLAPNGEVRALDAFIQGPEVIVPGKVIGGDNLQGDVKGQAAAPVVSVSLSVNTGLGTETAAGDAKDEAIKQQTKKRDAASVLTVDLLGMGDMSESAPPAAGNVMRNGGGGKPESAEPSKQADHPSGAARDCDNKPSGCQAK